MKLSLGPLIAMAKSRLPARFGALVSVAEAHQTAAVAAVEDGHSSAEAHRLARAGAAVVLGFFGFLGGWAALSPLQSAAVTYGVIGAEGSRKSVQHLDGGVVRAVLVREGDKVSAGQELLQLDQIQPRAALEIYTASVDTLTCLIARLEAEQSKAQEIGFPEEITARSEEVSVRSLIHSQEQIFSARRTALASQVETIRTQVSQAKSQTSIYRGQIETAELQYQMVREELAPKQMLYDKGYATNASVMQLKRAATALAGQKKEFAGHIRRLEHTVAQLESQIAQIESDQQLKVAQELEDARTKLADARERQRVAQDVLDRTIIKAPVGGNVLGLAVNTVGGVIGKGDKLMEIVPDDGGLVIKGRLKPSDGIEVSKGMRTELRILSAQGRTLPLLHGVVRNRSADARTDAATASLYYDIEVVVAPEDLKTVEKLELLPGTPIEVIIPTGSRTVLTYIFEPITDSLRQGLREK